MTPGIDESVSEFVPFDLKKDGQVIKAGAMFHKNGFFYVNDRKTGKLLSATPFVTKITWASSIDLATGRPVETGTTRRSRPERRWQERQHRLGGSELPWREELEPGRL